MLNYSFKCTTIDIKLYMQLVFDINDHLRYIDIPMQYPKGPKNKEKVMMHP